MFKCLLNNNTLGVIGIVLIVKIGRLSKQVAAYACMWNLVHRHCKVQQLPTVFSPENCLTRGELGLKFVCNQHEVCTSLCEVGANKGAYKVGPVKFSQILSEDQPKFTPAHSRGERVDP